MGCRGAGTGSAAAVATEAAGATTRPSLGAWQRRRPSGAHRQQPAEEHRNRSAFGSAPTAAPPRRSSAWAEEYSSWSAFGSAPTAATPRLSSPHGPTAVRCLSARKDQEGHPRADHTFRIPPSTPPDCRRYARHAEIDADQVGLQQLECLFFEMWNSGHGTLNMELLVRRSCVAVGWLRRGGWSHTREQPATPPMLMQKFLLQSRCSRDAVEMLARCWRDAGEMQSRCC